MVVYILQSLSKEDCFYVGLTTNPENRLKQHNTGQVTHTSKYTPWKLKNYFWFEDESKARKFEKYLKSGSGRAFSIKHF